MHSLVMLTAAAGSAGIAVGPVVGFPLALTYLQGAGLFVGVPVLVMFLIALPIFGPVWWQRIRRHRASTGGSVSTTDDAEASGDGGNADSDSGGEEGGADLGGRVR